MAGATELRTLNELFVEVCKNGELDNARRLREENRVFVRFNNDEAFRAACTNGQLSVARWLHEDVVGVEIDVANQEAFFGACMNGHLAVARWLHGGVHACWLNRDMAFRYACSNGHLDVARWLHYDVGVNVHAGGDAAFQLACSNGQLAVARWLHAVGHVDVRVHDVAFVYACANGHLDTARWLHDTLGGVNVHLYGDQAFHTACQKRHHEVALWLDSDEVWCGGSDTATTTRRDRPAECVKYVQGVRWSEMRRQWIGVVASFCASQPKC